jgi:hypothetical protein
MGGYFYHPNYSEPAMKHLDSIGRVLKGLEATILLALAAPVAQAQCAFG